MPNEAAELGADAVFGVGFVYGEISPTGTPMLMLVAGGIAVKLSKPDGPN
ncbi:heavy metal-binding domain-containing protein [Phaeobacter sp. NW0010-22]